MNVLVFLDGVLKNNSNAPILQGVALYRSLQAQRRTLILCDERELTEVWLRENKIVRIDDLLCMEDFDFDDPFSLVEYCRSKGTVELVVTADPELATTILDSGIPTLLFLSPKYIRPEFRPDAPRGAKAWADLTASLDKQDELYREDPRA